VAGAPKARGANLAVAAQPLEQLAVRTRVPCAKAFGFDFRRSSFQKTAPE